MEKYTEGKYKQDFKRIVLIDREGYMLRSLRDREIREDIDIFGGLSTDMVFMLDRALEQLFETGYARIVQGVGTWLELDMNDSVVPTDGIPRTSKLPPLYYNQLDDEIKAKLK